MSKRRWILGLLVVLCLVLVSCGKDKKDDKKDDVKTEHGHTDKAADDGTEESVSAGEPGVADVIAHTEDGTDAGEGGISTEGGV